MDFDLSPELQELQATVRRIAQDKVAPRAREIDVSEEYPQDLFDLFVETGLTGLCIPEAYGGSGAGILGLAIAIEEISKYSNAAALMLLLTRLPDRLAADRRLRGAEAEVPHAARDGEQRAAFGLSEPQAGSDVMGMRTRAERDGDGWRLTGTKCWMSGVVQADWYCVFAKTGPADSRAHDSISVFIVERGWDGVSVGRTDKKMGVKGVDTGELLLDNVFVPDENVVGEIGGFQLCMLGPQRDAPDRGRARDRPRRGRADVRGGVREGTRRVHQDDRRLPGHRSGASPSSRPRSRRRACSPTAPRGSPTRASSPRSGCPTCRCASTTPPSSR